MEENSLKNTPEPLLRFVKPKKESGIALEQPGHLRTVITMLTLSVVLIGGAFLTSWLVFTQSKTRRSRQKIDLTLRKTSEDLPANYQAAVTLLSKNKAIVGTSKAGLLMGEYAVFLALTHDLPDLLNKGTYLTLISGKRNNTARDRLKSITAIAKLIVERRFAPAGLLIEKELVKFPRSHLHFYALAMVRMEQGNYEAAHSSITLAMELAGRRLPYLLLRAAIERRRGSLARSRKLLAEVLAASPNHPIAPLELLMCGDDGPLPDPGKFKSRRARAKIYYLKGERASNPKTRLGLCERSKKLWFSPEASLCCARALLDGTGKTRQVARELRGLARFPNPQVKLLKTALYVRQNKPEKALASLKELHTCPNCDKEKVAALSVAIAALTGDRQGLTRQCSTATGEIIHTCLEGAIPLREWALVKQLIGKLPEKEHAHMLTQLLYNHSIAPAFGKPATGLRTYQAVLLSKALVKASRTGAALKLLFATARVHGYSPLLRLTLAETYFHMGRKSKGLAELERIRPLVGRHPEYLLRVALLYLAQNQTSSAMALATTISRLEPEGYRAPYIKTLIHIRAKQYKKAQMKLDQAMKVSKANPQLLAAKARICFYEGKYPEAIATIEKAMAVDRGNPAWLEKLAAWSKHYKQAHYGTYYWKAFELYLAKKAPYAASLVLAGYGNQLNIATYRDEKSRIMQRLSTLKMLHPLALDYLASWHHMQDIKSPEAITLLKKAVTLAPEMPLLRYKLATWLEESDPKNAIAQLEYILEKFGYHPITAKAKTLLATLRSKQGGTK